MKIIILTLCLVAGAFAGPAVQQQEVFAEGPACPIEDPLERDGPLPINVTVHPLAQLLEGSQITNLVANGLSSLTYNININVLLLTATFEVTIPHTHGHGTFTAEGYLDARPFRPETIPSGNFTGSGLGQISADDLHIKGRASLFINIIGNKVSVNNLNLEDISFRAITVDLGDNVTIGGEKIDFEELNRNLKANFDKDLADNKAAITEKIRQAANGIVGKYTLAELIALLPGGGGGGGEEPCETKH
jgi:hypothetical protein